MVRSKRRIFWVFACAILAACGGQGEADVVIQAETIVAAQEPTETTAPSRTPVPTDTPQPTATETALPTETPTITPTPGPVVFSDDFTANAGSWRDCRGCQWTGGAVVMGPYGASVLPEGVVSICEPCGAPTFFRMAVDATFVEGQTDRGYGLVFGHTEHEFQDLEISPLFLLTVAYHYDRRLESWTLLNPNLQQLLSGLVKAGYATNRLEILVQPTGASTADLFFKVNGRTAFIFYNRRVEAGEVGLIVGFHSIAVSFDNFEFEELEP